MPTNHPPPAPGSGGEDTNFTRLVDACDEARNAYENAGYDIYAKSHAAGNWFNAVTLLCMYQQRQIEELRIARATPGGEGGN